MDGMKLSIDYESMITLEMTLHYSFYIYLMLQNYTFAMIINCESNDTAKSIILQ